MSLLAGHGGHIALTLGPMAAIAAVATGADIKARFSSQRAPGSARSLSPSLVMAALLSVVAAVVHGIVCPEHFEEATLYGTFFAVAALCQLGWAVVVLVKPSRSVVLLGLAGNVAVLALWTITRTVGIPLGPESGTVEAVGALDVIATVAELGVALFATSWVLRQRRGLGTASSGTAAA